MKSQFNPANADPVSTAERPLAGQQLAVQLGPVATAPIFDHILVPGALDLGMIAADFPSILKDVPEFAGRVSAKKATVTQREHPLTACPGCSHQHCHDRKTPTTPMISSGFKLL
jgi:hypothetical protein